MERQITVADRNHILTNTAVWSPDGDWIVYDIRSDPAGVRFDGTRIEAVHVSTGEVKRLYESRNGAHCGVATWHPNKRKIIFILGPENPTPNWQYAACHRQGIVVHFDKPGFEQPADARDLTPTLTRGALRGGTHLHIWDAKGEWISFTYNDALADSEMRVVGVGIPGPEVIVKNDHPRNQSGSHFSAIISRTHAAPHPGSDEIRMACEESWVGRNGYTRPDGSRSVRALAFQGQVIAEGGVHVWEIFISDLPDESELRGYDSLSNTANQRPTPAPNINQRRLTFTTNRKYPGLQGPRHWLHSSPDGSAIGCLMKDDAGNAQLWLVSPNGGPPRQLTNNPWPIASAFTWSPDGRWIAHVMDASICVTDTRSGQTRRLTDKEHPTNKGNPRPEACVFSPDGRQIAFVRPVWQDGNMLNQIHCLSLPETELIPRAET